MLNDLKLHKILVWIPILNFLMFFIWSINVFLSISKISLFKLIKLCAITLILSLVCVTIEMKLYQWVVMDFSFLVYLLYYMEGTTAGLIFIQSEKRLFAYTKEG